jgi:hypothetical protein
MLVTGKVVRGRRGMLLHFPKSIVCRGLCSYICKHCFTQTQAQKLHLHMFDDMLRPIPALAHKFDARLETVLLLFHT